MWSRKMLKNHAKNLLSRSYWSPFVVCLLAGIITGGIGAGSRFTGRNDLGNTFDPSSYSFNDFGLNPDFEFLPALLPIISLILFIFSITFIVGIAYSFFVSNPVNVGKARFFLENRSGYNEIGRLFYSFRGGLYISIVKAMAWRFLFTFLWSLLFLVPGIIKMYSYSMVPYILADNPNIGYERALNLSMDMTRGYKFDIFVLQLSFLGWYLLGVICLGVGVLFVHPYYEATFAEMYVHLRNNAIGSGICNPYELNLIKNNDNLPEQI